MRDIKEEFILEGLPALNGVCGTLANHFINTSIRPHRISAYVASLIFCAAVTSRNYEFNRAYSNLYVMFFGDTGVGKGELEKMLRRWADDIKCPGIMMPGSSFTSDAAVQSGLVKSPQSIICIDEAGRMMASSMGDKVGSTAWIALTKVYTSSDIIFNAKVYSKGPAGGKTPQSDRETPVIRPALSVLGFGTHEQFQDICTEENFSSGDLSRYMYFYIPKGAVARMAHGTDHLPQRAIERMQSILELGGNVFQNLTEDTACIVLQGPANPLPVPIRCYLESGDINLDDLDEMLQKRASTYDSIVEVSLNSRWVDKAIRLSIPLALLNQPFKQMQSISSIKNMGVIITQDTFRDALEISSKSIKVIKRHIDETPMEPPRVKEAGDKIVQLICDTIMAISQDYVTRRDIKMAGIKIHPNDWAQLETYLQNEGVEVVYEKGTTGRPAARYQIINSAPVELVKKRNMAQGK